MNIAKSLACAALFCVTPAYARSPGGPVSKELKEAVLGMHYLGEQTSTSCYIELVGEKVVNGPCILQAATVKDAACTGYFANAGHLKPEFRDKVPYVVACQNPSIGGFGFQIKDDDAVIDLGLLTWGKGVCLINPSVKICWREAPLPPF